MQMHHKKKIEMIVDAACLPQLLKMCERVGAKGYTVIPNVSGKGNRGVRGNSDIFDIFRNVLLIVIAAEEIAVRIVEESQPLLRHYAGIIYTSDVDVVRDEHF
jgi:nitrogen regulatory protein PII